MLGDSLPDIVTKQQSANPAGKQRARAKKAPAKRTRRNVAWNQIEKMLGNARVWRHVCATQHDWIGEAYWHGQQDALERLRAELAMPKGPSDGQVGSAGRSGGR
jgi:hypothetical protein